MDSKYKLLVVAIVALAVLLGFLRFYAVERENRQLTGDLQQTRQRISELASQNLNISQMLEQEKQQRQDLEVKNAQIKSVLKAGVRRITSQRSSLDQLQRQAQQLESEIDGLRSENASLHLQQQEIKDKLAEVTKEYENYQRNIISFTAIKLTLRDLKAQAYKAMNALENRNHTPVKTDGNRGFLVKSGKSTNLPKFKIEVNPAPLE